MKKFSRFVSGLFIGGFVGATLALLFTPSSGEDLQQEIKQKTQNLQAEIQKAAHERRLELEKQLEELRKGIPQKAQLEPEE